MNEAVKRSIAALTVAMALATGAGAKPLDFHDGDSVPDGAIKVVADLCDAHCSERIFAAADGLAPVRLLVNNAARFAEDALSSLSGEEFDAHMNIF